MRKFQARVNVECLEARELLSVAYTPAQIRHAYGFDQVAARYGLDGRGQTIAIIDVYDDPTIAYDLAVFDQTFGLPDPPSFIKVNQLGGSFLPPVATQAEPLQETSLDVEWAHAIAPAANILLVEANSLTNTDLGQAIDYARHQPGVVTVSMSFGGPEFPQELFADSLFTTPAGHIGGSGLPGGITFVASTGDSGAPGGYPAYSPNVLAVGGTSLYLDSQGNYLGEIGWSGSGGGISQLEPEPAYQYSVQNTGARTIPDVSYDGDPSTGFLVYDTLGAGGWTTIAGTSAGAPQWAALMTLVDQARAVYLNAGSLDGATQTLPALYSPQLSGDFFDVVSGYNGFFAGPGYDLVTGLGSPYAPYVVVDLALVGFNSNAPGGAAPSASFAAAPDQQAMQAVKSAVDTVFADPGLPVATTPHADFAHLSTQGPASDTGSVHDTPALLVAIDSWKTGGDLDAFDAGMETEMLNVSL